MTFRTIVRKLTQAMARILYRCEIILMALITLDVCQIIIAVRVTFLACGRRMGAGQWEMGVRMIERAWLPYRSRVTIRTIMIELSCDMIWFCGNVFILVALIAIGVGDVIIPVQMTFFTSGGSMRTGQREVGGSVVETRFPGYRVVTLRAIMIEFSGDMVWFCHRGIIGLMTSVTSRIGDIVVSVHMAFFTGGRDMRAGEIEVCL